MESFHCLTDSTRHGLKDEEHGTVHSSGQEEHGTAGESLQSLAHTSRNYHEQDQRPIHSTTPMSPCPESPKPPSARDGG